MIDVLTLLFCIFLLMPYVKPGDEGGDKADPQADKAAIDPDALKREMEKLQRERERLAGDREKTLRHQVVCVLDIDAASGKLFHRGFPRQEIAVQADAFVLIERERASAP